MKVGIIGLGYVGLPLACLCAKKGHEVYGIDLSQEKIDLINCGRSPIKDCRLENDIRELKDRINATTDEKAISKCDIILICVPTPIDDNNNPDLSFVKNASEIVARNLKENQIIVLESTVSPGTVSTLIKPILDATNKKYFLGHSPERVDPGNEKWTIENTPKIVGAIDSESLEKITDFYKTIITADVVKVSSVEAAEATKIVENSFRDINIAFVNELAMSFDKIGIDVKEVIDAATTKPFAFMPHYPGCGVGGHCISVDPYYLIKTAEIAGFSHKFMKLARKINENMPNYLTDIVKENVDIKNSKITVLGLAYKKDVDDTRNSPAKKIIKNLKNMGATIKIYDPFIKTDFDNLTDAIKADVLVICTDHTEFKKMDLKKLKESGVKTIIDGRNMLDKNKCKELGIKYRGIGK